MPKRHIFTSRSRGLNTYVEIEGLSVSFVGVSTEVMLQHDGIETLDRC